MLPSELAILIPLRLKRSYDYDPSKHGPWYSLQNVWGLLNDIVAHRVNERTPLTQTAAELLFASEYGTHWNYLFPNRSRSPHNIIIHNDITIAIVGQVPAQHNEGRIDLNGVSETVIGRKVDLAVLVMVHEGQKVASVTGWCEGEKLQQSKPKHDPKWQWGDGWIPYEALNPVETLPLTQLNGMERVRWHAELLGHALGYMVHHMGQETKEEVVKVLSVRHSGLAREVVESVDLTDHVLTGLVVQAKEAELDVDACLAAKVNRYSNSHDPELTWQDIVGGE